MPKTMAIEIELDCTCDPDPEEQFPTYENAHLGEHAHIWIQGEKVEYMEPLTGTPEEILVKALEIAKGEEWE